jgi:hypothetical protein
MLISLTISRTDQEQARKLEVFLGEYVIRMRQYPGVIAIYHFKRPVHGDEITITVWESDYALRAFGESDLMAELQDFERAAGIAVSREAHSVLLAL